MFIVLLMVAFLHITTHFRYWKGYNLVNFLPRNVLTISEMAETVFLNNQKMWIIIIQYTLQ